MSTTWFAHDTHFDHGNIIKHANRPFDSLDDMNEELVDQWNAVVGKGDTVYVSDFAWKNHAHWLNRLKGSKILVVGSHDRMSTEVLAQFKEVFTAKMISVNNQLIWCSHCAHRVWEKCHYGAWHVFGHSHGRLQTWNLSTDGGIDVNSRYRPYSFDELKEEMKLREAAMGMAGRIITDERTGKTLYRQDDCRHMDNLLSSRTELKGVLHE